jgi:hypothetical protein
VTTAAALANLEKTSADRLDYDIDYGKWLTDDDVISSATASVTSPDVSFSIDVIEVTSQVVRVWVFGGVNGDVSEIAVFATTMAGRIKEARFVLQIKDE